MQLDASKAGLTVGVVGTGTMGRGIVQVAAAGGLDVRATDARPGAAADAVAQIAEAFRRSVDRGKLDARRADAALARIEVVDGLAGLRGCDVVIEVIVEQLAAKQELFAALDALLPPQVILATNTSSLSVTEIAAACGTPSRVAGFHFFNPVPAMALVEVIPGVATAQWVTDALRTVGRRMGREPVLAMDSPGFLVNHIGRAYMPEALRLLAERVAGHDAIDAIMRGAAGFRMGPFELLDLVGADVAHAVMESLYAQFYQEPMYQPSPLLRRRVVAGVLGRKTGGGFYGPPAAEAPPPPDRALEVRARPVWISRREPDGAERVRELLARLGAAIDDGDRPGERSLCVTTPLGKDTTTSAAEEGLDFARTVAVDTLFPLERHRTLMVSPATSTAWRDAASATFGADGTEVTVIGDSPGFVAQRIVAMLVNVGCNVAQLGVASPEDIDKAARLGLNYPWGPLELGDRLGAGRILRILEGLHAFYGDPRYRPMAWLRRRAMLGASLLVPNDASA